VTSLVADQYRRSQRQRSPAQFVDGSIDCRSARAFEEGIACRPIQVERGRQGAHGFGMRSSAVAALESADGMDGEASDRRQFLLREPGRLA